MIGGGIGVRKRASLILQRRYKHLFASPHGNGAIDARHYLAQNLMCQEDWDNIDVVLSVGTRYQAQQLGPTRRRNLSASI